MSGDPPHQQSEPGKRRARRRATGWRAFETGAFENALQTFDWLNQHDTLDDTELDLLVTLKSDIVSPAAAIDSILLALGRSDDGHLDRARWTGETVRLLGDPRCRSDQGAALVVRLLESLAGLNDTAAWTELARADPLRLIDSLASDPVDRLDALEQLTFAPAASGLPARAIGAIEAIGHLARHDPPVSRAAERLLHDLQQVEAAYGVERARRGVARVEPPSPSATASLAPRFAGLTIVLAGGHPALRSLIARDLSRDGVRDVRDVPSAREAVRSGRDVAAVVGGVDLVVLLVRQLAHSTSDQVKDAARKAGVPVVVAERAGTSGVRRAVERWLRPDSLDTSKART